MWKSNERPQRRGDGGPRGQGVGVSDTAIYQEIGARIRALRQKRNLTQKELAQWIGVPQNTVSRWETGAYQIAIHELQVLAALFGVPLSAMIEREGRG